MWEQQHSACGHDAFHWLDRFDINANLTPHPVFHSSICANNMEDWGYIIAYRNRILIFSDDVHAVVCETQGGLENIEHHFQSLLVLNQSNINNTLPQTSLLVVSKLNVLEMTWLKWWFVSERVYSGTSVSAIIVALVVFIEDLLTDSLKDGDFE